MRTMNSDGSNNRQLGFGLFGNPSMALHGGHRWFLYHKPIPDSFYPDGTQVFELFALRDDYDSGGNNNSTTKVQLHEQHEPAKVDKATRARVSESYGKLPLSFEANEGQQDGQVKFLSRGSGYNLFLTNREAVLVLSKPEKPARRLTGKRVIRLFRRSRSVNRPFCARS